MTDFKIVPSIDLNDPYAQAKLDVIKAKESLSKLTPIQQRALVEELFGVAFVDMILTITNNNLKR